MQIETERLILKEYNKDDIEAFYSLKSDKEVWIYSTFKPLTDRKEAVALLDCILSNRKNTYPDFLALFEKKTMQYIGEAGIIGSNPNASRGEVGYNLLPEYWKRGYATEILSAIVKWAFQDRQYERLEALALECNTASCKVLEKCGFQKEGVLRNFNKWEYGFRNVNYYGMIYEDYCRLYY